MTERRTILIVGHAGRDAAAAAAALDAAGIGLRILAAPAGKAAGMAGTGVEIAGGDPGDAAALREACRGVDGVLMTGIPGETRTPEDAARGRAVIAVCRSLGVSRLVFVSTCRTGGRTGIVPVDTRRDVEASLRESGQPCTILRPAFFMENFGSHRLLPSILEGVLTLPLSPDRKIPMVSLADVGEFAAQAFLRPEAFIGREIDLAGDELTMEEATTLLSEALSRTVRYMRMSGESADLELGPDLARLYRWLDREAEAVDYKAARTAYGVPMTSFAEYLAGAAAFTRRKAA